MSDKDLSETLEEEISEIKNLKPELLEMIACTCPFSEQPRKKDERSSYAKNGNAKNSGVKNGLENDLKDDLKGILPEYGSEYNCPFLLKFRDIGVTITKLTPEGNVESEVAEGEDIEYRVCIYRFEELKKGCGKIGYEEIKQFVKFKKFYE